MTKSEVSALSPEENRFIDELGGLLATWGMPSAAGRLYAYLQLRNSAATLETIAADLQIGRSTAHASAKLLEERGNARRVGEVGTKRILYEAPCYPGAGLVRQTQLLAEMILVVEKNGRSIAKGNACARLEQLLEFYRDLRSAMYSAIQRSIR